MNNGSVGHVLVPILRSLLPLGRQHCSKPVQPAFPEGTTLRNPLLGDLQTGGLDVTGAYSTDLRRSNQTALFELLEMLHNGREGNVQRLSEVLRGLRRAAELLHNCPSGGISESMEHSADGGLVKHRLEYLRAHPTQSSRHLTVFFGYSSHLAAIFIMTIGLMLRGRTGSSCCSG